MEREEEIPEDKVKLEVSVFSEELEDFKSLHSKSCELVNEARLSTRSALGVTHQLFTDSRLLAKNHTDTVSSPLTQALELLDSSLATLIALEPTIKQILQDEWIDLSNVVDQQIQDNDTADDQDTNDLEEFYGHTDEREVVKNEVETCSTEIKENIKELGIKRKSTSKQKGKRKKLKSERENGNENTENLDPLLHTEEKFQGEEVNGKEVLTCAICKYTTNNRTYHQDHISGGLKYRKCPWCPLHMSQGIKRISQHLKKAHGGGKDAGGGSSPFNCLLCGEKLKRLSSLELHLAKVHGRGEEYHCGQCTYSSPCLKTVRGHVNTHKGPFCCDICGAFLASKASLRNHMEGKHGARKFHCELCSFSSTRKFGLTQHMSIHNGKIFLCDQCDFSTVHKANFTKHMQRKHSKEPRKETPRDQFPCDLCNSKYSTKLGLSRHKKSHTAPESIACTEDGCEYVTSRPDNLKHHVEKVHRGIRWPCKQCDYVGGYKSDLNRHIKVTHEGFLLKCTLCKYTTPKKCRLSWHMSKVHQQGPEGTKWVCDMCEFVAGYEGELNRHIKVVHNGFTLKCEFCEYTTPKKYRLKVHVKKVHQQKMQSTTTTSASVLLPPPPPQISSTS
eukprot:TRINITY_DN2436_c0_g1_i10.p1 TRINITY_DN2436_c0_g1~~TRINITY_DN2436_c0_g1_i10.p1  ORF type:complete len:616 (-),score=97.87 TRINITY_DN2436_c0_g1_i10:160-2007(-)